MTPLAVRQASPAEGGYATVVVVGIVCVLLTLTFSGLALGSAMVASHRARAAVDLAALAGANLLMRGGGAGQACAAAARTAAVNGAAMTECSIADAGSLAVRVSVQPGVRGLGHAVAAARAGPSSMAPASR